MKRVLFVWSAALLLVLPGAGQKKPRIAEDWLAAWNSHDAKKVIPIFTDDVFFEDVALGAVSHGSGELNKFATSSFAAVPDARFGLGNVSMERGHGTIEWVFSGTDSGLYKTGKKFSVRGVSLIEMRGGRISRELDFWDTASVMKQVGLSPCEKTNPSK
jgi:steroid delta-isomerase-like uncharacterized protein